VDGRTRLAILREVVQSRWRGRWPRDQLLAHQQRELARLRAHAYQHSPFYQRFHAGLTDRPLSELPLHTKPLMMEHFDELVADRAVRLHEVETQLSSGRGGEPYLEQYWLTRTSGSSGLHGVFVHDRAEMAAFLATFLRASAVSRTKMSPFRRRRQALVIAGLTGGDLTQLTGRRRAGLVSVRLFNRLAPLEQVVAELNAWQPEFIYIMPSFAGELAQEQLAGRLRIAPLGITPSGEVLTDQIRERIRSAWGDIAFDAYGAAECGLLGIECPQHRGLHLVNDRVILEVVDAANQPVPPGQYGAKVLVTVLFRRTQPLIRYELSDLVCLDSTACACGHPTPRIAVQGRIWEVLRLPSQAGGQVEVLPLAIFDVMRHVNADYQVIQEPQGLRVLLSQQRGAMRDEAVAAALRQAIEAVGAIAPPVRVEHVATIPPEPSGKVPLIKSESCG
jgi:putative adenylate-forming enzyme